jgi:RNA polymerase sigma factor (sigma-70 family)
MHERVIIDSALWESCKQGNKQAYGAVYKIFYPRLFVYGSKFTTDTIIVEDCIQETFTSFWMNREKLPAVKSLQPYLFVSFRNRLFKDLQRNQYPGTRTPDQDGYTFYLQLSADQLMIDAEKLYEQSICLRDAIDRLTSRQKEAVYLKFYFNLSYEEIANLLGISIKATYKLFARAVQDLRQTYQKKMISLTMG